LRERISLQFDGTAGLAMARQSLYGAARIGDIVVISNLRPTPGWAVIVLSVAALSLAGCGRKSGLDAPPGAASSAVGPTDSETEAASKPSLFSNGVDAPPQAPRGNKSKSFILDPILDERRESAK
jgi:predicted small lipoprotein YifL